MQLLTALFTLLFTLIIAHQLLDTGQFFAGFISRTSRNWETLYPTLAGMFWPTFTPVHNWRKQKNRSGRYKVHIRVTIGYTSRYAEVKLPQKVSVDEWNPTSKTQWVRNSHPYAPSINDAIAKKLDLVRALINRYHFMGRPPGFDIIIKELKKGYNTDLFNSYFEEVVKKPLESLDEVTIKRYGSALASLNKFRKDIAFFELDDLLLEAAKQHMETVQKLAGSTILGYFNAFKKVCKWARKEGHITREHEETLFEDIRIKKSSTAPDFLEEEEIIAWKKAPMLGPLEKWTHHRDIFYLMICTGLYYSDITDLEKTDLRNYPAAGPYIFRGRSKNDYLSVIPLWIFPDAIAVIEKYKDTDPDSKWLIDRKYLTAPQVFNRLLKDIATEALGWKRNMVNKNARQTYGMLLLRYKVYRPAITKMFGHVKDETLDHYAKLSADDVLSATMDINFKDIAGL